MEEREEKEPVPSPPPVVMPGSRMETDRLATSLRRVNERAPSAPSRFNEEIKAYWLARLQLMQIGPAINVLFIGRAADISTELGAKLTGD